jgi:hypothetical protein
LWIETPGGSASLAKLDTENEISKDLVVDFTKVRDEDFFAQGITLKKALDLHIYSIGEGTDGDMYDYGWIVNTKTREKVWVMDYDDTQPAGGSRKNRMYDAILRLEPGNYMVYYMTDDSHAYRDWNESPPYDKKHYGLSIAVVDDTYSKGDIVEYQEEEDASILAKIVRVRDGEHRKSRFTLDKDGYIHVYALGEGSDGEMYDYAWIENSNTGRVVWEMTFRKTDRAGGARKNRLFDDRILLEAGDYVVYYETDDSHSFNDWNDRPPRDQFSWGVTISRTEE